MVMAACSPGTPAGSPATSERIASPGSPASSGQEQPSGSDGESAINVFVDLVECENLGGAGAASGTIENLADQPAAYRILIAFLDAAGTPLAEGSGDTTTAAPGSTVDWSVSVGGLGDAEVSCRTADVKAIDGAGTATSPATVGEYPCTLVAQATVEQLAGNALEPGDAATNHHDQDGVLWTAAECAWLSFEPEPVGVNLEVTKADGFPSGSVGCPPLPGSGVPVEGLGAPATWSWTDPGTTATVGTLRVCDPAALIDVRVDGSIGGEALRAVAVGVASAALASL